MSIYIGDKEIKNLYAGGSIIVSDMQGPCPDGFHIPQSSERTNIFNAGESIGAWNLSGDSNAKNRKIINYLKLPTHGGRSGSDGSASTSQSNGYYESPIWYDSSNCYVLRISRDSDFINVSSTSRLTNGHHIRPFRNEPVVPNSSRTVLYQGTGTAGIYHNPTLGLISISSNGTTRYTIADKNLGATTTFDAWDATQTAENCGGQFQRGNNYMFPFSGSVTTSTTQVDASNYGPGNYYESSTFIKRSYSPYNWDSSNNQNLWGGVTQGTSEKAKEAKAVYLGDTKVRPSGPDKDYLCFTAEQANSTVKLNKSGSPTAVNLETSTDGLTWTGYTIGSTLTLSAVGDKIYFRNTSETTTGFSTGSNAYYQFVMTGSIAASGDITSLINKNLTTTLVGDSCFYNLFYSCTSLTKCPKLPATTLTESCYYWMFNTCSNLETLPALPATNIPAVAYYGMFNRCSKIKLSTTQTGEYQTPYRIPTEGTGTKGSEATDYMFSYTGGTFIGSGRSRQADINTTYYTSNTVV